MKKRSIDDLSILELDALKWMIHSYTDIYTLKKDVNEAIMKKINVQKLYQKFTIQMFLKLGMIQEKEFEILADSNILNLDDLMNCDLNRLFGSNHSFIEKMNWLRQFYSLEEATISDTRKSL